MAKIVAKQQSGFGAHCRLLLFSVVLSFCFQAGTTAAETPENAIARLNGTLLNVMQNAESLGYQGRYDALSPVLTELYNFRFMAKVAVGGYWKSLSEAERDKLLDAFSRFSIATYASRFDGYSGEQFEVVSSEPSVHDTILVKTDLVKSNGEKIALNYLTRDRGQGAQIIDVLLDARVSELARLRADYTSVIRRDSFASLIAIIEERIAQIAGAN